VLRLIGPAAASFALCLLAMFALRPLAIALDLVDRPVGRKTHHGEVPIVGGLAMFLGMILGIGVLPLADGAAGAFLGACAVLVTIGLIDDRFDVSPWMRLPTQIASTLLLMIGTGAVVTSLGAPFGSAITLSLSSSIAFTIMITVAAVNAFNMLDGMDGLAGATALTSMLALAYVSWTAGLKNSAGVSLVVAGAICAFLMFNLPVRVNRPVRCFMGDAGSTLLGFSVAWVCIRVSQGPTRALAPVTTLWIVALPLYELLWSTVRRIVRGVSPLRADTAHFHHLLLKGGFSVRAAFGFFVALSVLLAGIGIALDRSQLPESYSLLLLALSGAAIIRLMYRAELLWRLIPESWRRRVRPLDILPSAPLFEPFGLPTGRSTPEFAPELRLSEAGKPTQGQSPLA
jgi:UDP-GlcNAc:undecaprenyl-phosphate GlcNAc-1-phosphate transferase